MSATNLIEDLRMLSPPAYGWAAAAGAAIVVAGALVWAVRRGVGRAKDGSDQGGVVTGDGFTWEQAMAALERLTPLLRPECSRDYGIASTSVVRRYIEGRYGLRAPLQTTEEFLAAARLSAMLPVSDRDALGEFLGLCDLFKFGRFVASVAELARLQESAVAFVLRSRPMVAPSGAHTSEPATGAASVRGVTKDGGAGAEGGGR
jgi:hypothetical protein